VYLLEEIAAANTQALETPPSAAAHLHLKGQTQNVRFCKPSKSDNFNMLYKNICGLFCAKTTHTHTHTHTHWGHQIFILHLVKMSFYQPFKVTPGNFCSWG